MLCLTRTLPQTMEQQALCFGGVLGVDEERAGH